MRNKCYGSGGGENSLGTNAGEDLVSELIWPLIVLGLSAGLDSYSTPGSLTLVTEVTSSNSILLLVTEV